MIQPRVRETDWSQQYRPDTLKDCILPARIRVPLEKMVTSGIVQNLVFHGSCGVGKTSTARAICSDTNADVFEVNGSLDNSIASLRDDVEGFVSGCNWGGRRKIVFIDEAEGLSREYQDGLRGLMERVSGRCSFIFTANRLTKISRAIQSRCFVMDFTFSPQETSTMKVEFARRLSEILQHEGAKAEPRYLATVISTEFPEFRQILKQVQFGCAE